MKRIQMKIPGLSEGAKASMVYTLAILFSRGLAIVTMPVFTRLMSTDQIGVVNLYNSWYAILGTFATLSLTSGGYMVAMKEYRKRREQYISSVLTLTCLIALVLTGVYFIAPQFWNNITGLSTPLSIMMLLGFLVTPATDFWLSRQRYEYKYKSAGLLSMFSALTASGLSTAAIIIADKLGYNNLGEIRLFANNLIVYGVAFILCIDIFYRGRTFFNYSYWRFSLTLSIPLIGHCVAAQILSVSDRSMISKMIGNDAVGIYSTLYTVSTLSTIVWGAINASFIPYLFENIEKKEKLGDIRKISLLLLCAYSLVAVIMTLLAPEIVAILATEEYYEAIYIMPPIAAGVFLNSISNMYSNILVYYKKTSYIMISSIIAAFINVSLNYIFIKIWGYMAAAYTTLIAYIIMAFMQGLIARRIHKKITGDKKNYIYQDTKLMIVSAGTIFLCLCCLLFYKNMIIRYCIISGIFILAILFKDRWILFLSKKRTIQD